MVKRKYFMVLAMCAALGACDGSDEQANAQQQQPSAGEATSQMPAAGESAPGTTSPGLLGSAEGSAPGPISGDLSEAEGSMDETSPQGEAVTEQELPQSDLPPPSREAFTDASCDFEAWVGKEVDEAAVKATGRPYRILKPDSMMTMDHSPDRINVVHGEDGIVTRVWCG